MGNELSSSFNCVETLAALKGGVQDPVIALRGLRRICELASNDENREKLGGMGVCEVVLLILQTHQSKLVLLDFF